MRKGTKKFIVLTAGVLASMYAYNRMVDKNASSKGLLDDSNGSYYNWKYGDVFYTKRGTGKPVLLLHDLSPESSSFEWAKIMKRLERNHTVYTMDLLGCGRSDKPSMTYTNYLYVQLLTSFIKEVIGEKTDVIATNLTSSVVITSNNMDENLYDQIILINPAVITETSKITETEDKIKQVLLSTPLIGTFIYNVLENPKEIERKFEKVYFSKNELSSSSLKDVYYEAAHYNESTGKYLLGSIYGKYMNLDIHFALKKCQKPIHIIASRELKDRLHNISEYEKMNDNVETTYISNCKLLPQLEIPEKTYTVINGILEED